MNPEGYKHNRAIVPLATRIANKEQEVGWVRAHLERLEKELASLQRIAAPLN